MLATERFAVAGTVESRAPAATGGTNVTETVQLSPATRVPHVFACANWVLSVVTPDTVIGVALMFVTRTVCTGEVVDMDCGPKSREAGAAESVGVAAAVTNAASTDVDAFTVSAQAPMPEQAPVHPTKTEPASGVAERLTALPAVTFVEQEAPQAMPAGVDVTVPEPVPDLVTVTGWVTTVTDLMQFPGESVTVPGAARVNDVQAVEVVVPSVTCVTCADAVVNPMANHAPRTKRETRPIAIIR